MYKNEQVLIYVFECKGKLKIEDNELRKVDLGKLIVGTDPLTVYNKAPYTVTVKPGQYPVSVYLDEDDTVRKPRNQQRLPESIFAVRPEKSGYLYQCRMPVCRDEPI